MKLSSYNIKWIVLYIIYALWMLAEYDFGFDYNKISDCMEEVIWLLLLAPLLAYLLFPLVYKYIGTWKPIRWIDGAIDYIYRTIREPSKQHEMNIEKSAALSTDCSIPMIIPKKDNWIWKVLKVLLWVAVIWGIFILIYVIPALGVPVAALAGYVGVKMTKKKNEMTEDVFEKRYAQRLVWAENNNNIRTLSSLVLECAHIIHEEDADAIKYVNRIQQDLLDKGIIPFMIKSVNDRIRVDELPDNEIKEFLKKVLLAYEYKNDDRWR